MNRFILLYGGMGVDVYFDSSRRRQYRLVDAVVATPFVTETEAWLTAEVLLLPAQNCAVRPLSDFLTAPAIAPAVPPTEELNPDQWRYRVLCAAEEFFKTTGHAPSLARVRAEKAELFERVFNPNPQPA
jgi:hypothetical protein